MPTNAQKLFNFTRSLPEPFHKLTNKKVKVSFYFGDGMEATLTATVIKAVHAYLGCVYGTADGALGMIDHRSVVEYKSASGPNLYHIMAYDPSSGQITGSVYDKNTEALETYTIGNKARDGSAVLMAMLPELMTDGEFNKNLSDYTAEFNKGFPDLNEAQRLMGIICDNAYRRIVDDGCIANVKIKIEASGNLMRISQTQLDSCLYAPKSVLAGEFTIFSQSASAPILYTVEESADHSGFIGKYSLNPARILNPREQSLVPALQPWYILPDQVVSVCKHAQASSVLASPMRNFLLRGPAGTGKTEGAKAIAAGLNLPYVKYTCSANTEIYDFIGQVFPETGFQTTDNAELDKERKWLMDMGGITYENVSNLLGLPGLDDIDYDPSGVYKAVTGIDRPDATTQECMAVVMGRVTDKVHGLSQAKSESQSSGQSYTYIETDFIRALKYGYCCEVQEPATIMQPGVLVGLNGLLEQFGTITLPTGEIIRRHPDAVIIVTTNTEYEGCRGMNQSVTDRMNLILDIELPDPEIMARRAMSVTGCDDDIMVSQMVHVAAGIADYCRKNGITDGSCGMRSLIDWIISAGITGDPYESALHTIISKATANDEDRQSLIATLLEPQFAPKRRKSV